MRNGPQQIVVARCDSAIEVTRVRGRVKMRSESSDSIHNPHGTTQELMYLTLYGVSHKYGKHNVPSPN